MKRLESILLTTGSSLVFMLLFGLWLHAGLGLVVAYLLLLVSLPPLLAISLSISTRLVPASAAGGWLAAGLFCQVGLLALLWVLGPRPGSFAAFWLKMLGQPEVVALAVLPFWLGLLTAGWWLGVLRPGKPSPPPTRPSKV